MRKALQIKVSGEQVVVDLDSGDSSLNVMQDAVGGYIECVSLSRDLDMYVNEEGKLIGLDHNTVATHLWSMVYGQGTGTIEGDVLLTGGVDLEGETLGLTEYVHTLLENMAPVAMSGS